MMECVSFVFKSIGVGGVDLWELNAWSYFDKNITMADVVLHTDDGRKRSSYDVF